MSKVYTSVDQLIGNTPLLEATHLEKAEGFSEEAFADSMSQIYMEAVRENARNRISGV